MKNLIGSIVLALFLTACMNSAEKPENAQVVDSARMAEYVFHVEGMTCGGCENSIEKNVSALNGVTLVNASHTDSTVVVCMDTLTAQIPEVVVAIESKGYSVKGYARKAK